MAHTTVLGPETAGLGQGGSFLEADPDNPEGKGQPGEIPVMAAPRAADILAWTP